MNPTPEEADARDVEINGNSPRLPALRTEETLVPGRKIMAQIVGAASGQVMEVPDESIPDMVLTAMCHQELFERVVNVSTFLLKEPTLPIRERQLAILRVGWVRQIPYIWGEHVTVSRKLGLTSKDIEEVIVGSESTHWNELERAVLMATEELTGNTMISEETWSVLAAHLNDAQLFELPILVGQFSTVGCFQNALRIRLSPSNRGLKSR